MGHRCRRYYRILHSSEFSVIAVEISGRHISLEQRVWCGKLEEWHDTMGDVITWQQHHSHAANSC